MKIIKNIYQSSILQFVFLLGIVLLGFSCSKDDGNSDNQIIPSEALPLGQYNVIRYQLEGDCDEDGPSDLNPCENIEQDVKMCVSGTVEVILNELDLSGLVMIAESFGIEFNISVASISDAFDESSRGPLSDLIVYDIGNGQYRFEAKEKQDCTAVMTIESR